MYANQNKKGSESRHAEGVVPYEAPKIVRFPIRHTYGASLDGARGLRNQEYQRSIANFKEMFQTPNEAKGLRNSISSLRREWTWKSFKLLMKQGGCATLPVFSPHKMGLLRPHFQEDICSTRKSNILWN